MSSSKAYILILLASVSFATLAYSPEGLWAARSPTLGDKPIGKVKIYISNGNLTGELIEIYPLNKEFDRFCWRRKSLAQKTGPVIMCDYHESEGKWVGGKIYESSTGKVYLSEIKISPDGNHLLVKGTSGVFSETVVWDRLNG